MPFFSPLVPCLGWYHCPSPPISGVVAKSALSFTSLWPVSKTPLPVVSRIHSPFPSPSALPWFKYKLFPPWLYKFSVTVQLLPSPPMSDSSPSLRQCDLWKTYGQDTVLLNIFQQSSKLRTGPHMQGLWPFPSESDFHRRVCTASHACVFLPSRESQLNKTVHAQEDLDMQLLSKADCISQTLWKYSDTWKLKKIMQRNCMSHCLSTLNINP